MIPSILLLRREPFRSGLTEASYDPRLLLTKDGVLPSAPEGVFADVLEFNASIVHEWSHWFQHQATTCGAFLDALRFSQEITAIRWLRDLPRAKVRAMLDARDRGRPILAFEPASQQPILDPGDDQALNLFKQIWFDHQWFHAAFEDDIAFATPGPPPSQVFGEIFADVILSLCGEARFVSPNAEQIHSNIAELRTWYAFPGETPYIAYDGLSVTTRMIMETAATVAELDLLPETIWLKVLNGFQDTYWRRRIDRLLRGRYGTPFCAFLEAQKTPLDGLADLLPSLALVCFAALNPPVPPLVMAPPLTNRSYRWGDIYPPIRFMRLSAAVTRVGLARRWISIEQLSQYLLDLCDAAGLAPVWRLPYPSRLPGWGTVDFGDTNLAYSEETKATRHNYAFWAQAKVHSEISSRLPLFACLGQCFSGEYVQQYYPVLISDHDELEQVPYLKCPLYWTDTDKFGFACRSDFGNWLVRVGLMSEVIFDTVVGTGNYDFSRVPPQAEKSQSLREVLRASVEHNILNVANS
jgi:hypothetical protein